MRKLKDEVQIHSITKMIELEEKKNDNCLIISSEDS